MIWVATAFVVAALVALVVLLALGATWVGDELRAAAPDDPLLEQGAPIFGVVLFAGTVGPALTALPGLIAAVAGEALRIRSWMYYVLAGGGFPVSVRGAGVIGAVVVSGLPERGDHGMVVDALCDVLGQDKAALGLPQERK